MVLNRATFFESLVKESSGLNVIFLNHSGNPATLLIDISTIDLLADESSSKAFIAYASNHDLVKKVIVKKSYKRKDVMITCKDGSELNFQLVANKIRHSLSCLPVKDVYQEFSINEFEMPVPAVRHHFEYVLLKNQFNKTSFPDKLQKYFSSLNTENRIEIFRYIQPKYNLVFNTIEDQYKPKGGVLLKITIGLRHMKGNSLLSMTGRLFAKIAFDAFRLFTSDTVYLQGELPKVAQKKSKKEIEKEKRVAL